jgi:putative chitinase
MAGKIDRKFFFDHIRTQLFDGSLRQSQVDGINLFLDRWEKFHATDDRRWLAYMLATAHHETGRRFRPIEEIGGAARDYGKRDPKTGQRYFGRGYVQITHKDNYRKLGEVLGKDLVRHPELALVPDIALRILFFGMTNGSFTSRRLSQYFHGGTAKWAAARAIVNGTDKKDLIASYGKKYYAAISVPVG